MGLTAKERLCKQPSENIKFTMEFSGRLTSGETLSSITSVSSELIDGSTSDLTLSSEQIENNTQVTLWIDGGTATKQYRIEILVVTSGGQTLEGDGILKVIDR